MSRQLISLIALTLSLLLVGCRPTQPNTPIEQVEDNQPGVLEDTDMGFNAVVKDTGDIELIVLADSLPAPDGATAGELELTITFQNMTDEDITLDYTEEDYIILADGIEITPTTIADEIITPVVPASSTIAGQAIYTVESAIATYTFQLEGFESVEIDAGVDTVDE